MFDYYIKNVNDITDVDDISDDAALITPTKLSAVTIWNFSLCKKLKIGLIQFQVILKHE